MDVFLEEELNTFKILAIGDVIWPSGVEFLKGRLWKYRSDNKIDLVLANGENSARPNGIDKESAEMLFAYGVDVITTGNHVWSKRDISSYLDDTTSVLRPVNFPSACPGLGHTVKEFSGKRVLIMNAQGTLFMESLASPFEAVDAILKKERGGYDISVLDFHAEATSEKAALAMYFDGRISVIFGTHTHVQTNDARILKNGSAFITDLGMTGVYDSVIGVSSESAILRYLTKMPNKYEDAKGDCFLNGALFELDFETNKVTAVNTVTLY